MLLLFANVSPKCDGWLVSKIIKKTCSRNTPSLLPSSPRPYFLKVLICLLGWSFLPPLNCPFYQKAMHRSSGTEVEDWPIKISDMLCGQPIKISDRLCGQPTKTPDRLSGHQLVVSSSGSPRPAWRARSSGCTHTKQSARGLCVTL